jgi:arylsulfatase A-like enzyme
MRRFNLVCVVGILLALGVWACSAPPARRSATRPNVVFVLTDDQRWDAISISGKSGPLETPNIDRLGREGVYFRNAFATTALCSPSRASILSGQYAHAHGVKDNFTEFPSGTRTWPLMLQQSGYETAYVGKYHMGENNDEPRAGFTYFATHRAQGQYFDTEWRINGGERKVIPGYYTTVVSTSRGQS